MHTAVAVSSLPFYEPFPPAMAMASPWGGSDRRRLGFWQFGHVAWAIVTNNAALTRVGPVGSNSYGLLITGTPSATRNRAASFTAQTFACGQPCPLRFVSRQCANAARRRGESPVRRPFQQRQRNVARVCGVWVDSARQLFISKNSASTPPRPTQPHWRQAHTSSCCAINGMPGTSDDTVSLC